LIAKEIGQEDAADLEPKAMEFTPINEQPNFSNSIFDLHENLVGANHEQQTGQEC
jgi:hypothetical protein